MVAKKASKRKVAKKPIRKPVTGATRRAKATKRKPNAEFMRPMKPSKELAKVVGEKSIPRTQVVKKLWEYIKANKLQNPRNKRNIIANDTLLPVFGGKKEISMFEMTKVVAQHLEYDEFANETREVQQELKPVNKIKVVRKWKE